MDNSTVIEVCRASGDSVRLKIVNELREGARCACVLAEVAAVSPPPLSHHLKTLREVGLISGEHRGRWIDYSLVSSALEALSETLRLAERDLGTDGVGEVCPSWAFSSVS